MVDAAPHSLILPHQSTRHPLPPLRFPYRNLLYRFDEAQPAWSGTSAAGRETFVPLLSRIECALVPLDKNHIGLEG